MQSWTLAAFDHPTNSITITGADNAKTYVVGVRAKNADGGGGWRNSDSIVPLNPPPATPASVSVTRGDGALTASWDAAANATSYHVTYSTNGGASWSLAAFDHAGTSITIGANNGDTYVVGVRAKNSAGGSGWRNSPASGPYTPPTPVPDPPASVGSVSVTRADGSLTASWDAPSGATKYHITYSDDHGQSWTAAADAHPSTSITISVDNAEAYHVGVRAGNDGGWSGWTNSPTAYSWFPPERGIRIQDSEGNAITALAVPEGGEASYEVVLTAPPTETTKVCVYLSVRDKNDPDITFKGEADDVVSIDVIFTPDNWDTPQTVTLVAAEDDDYVNGARDSGLDARDYYAGKVDLAVTEIDNDLPAPANFTVTNGDGFFDLAWSAVTDATGYDVRAKINNSDSWSSVATGVIGTSYTYTTSAVVNKLAVRATNATAASAWSELSRGPNDSWLATVQQTGASAQSLVMAAAQGQSQLAAPASVTVTRDNYPYDEKLHVTWAAVSGASGYNLACTIRTDNQPLSSWAWWHCGSVTSGSTTTFTVDHDKRGGITRDLSTTRSYAVAMRAVTSDPAQASPWALSAYAHPAHAPDLHPDRVSISRGDGSVSLSWAPPAHLTSHTQGYEIDCATYATPYNPSYTRCVDVEDQTLVDGKISVTISSWTVGGTNYTIDDTKTYDLRVRTTNPWGHSTFSLAPLVHPNPALTVSNVGATGATLTIAHHSGNWYYKANAAPDNTCKGPVSGSTKALTGLTANASYIYSAYSDSTCTTANLLATAAQFTTLSSVSNLTSTKHATFESAINSTQKAGVAFTTGANTGGYVLKSVTVPLKNSGGTNGIIFELRAMEGTGDYSNTSEPSDTALATLSIATPTASTYTDTTVTCSGSGCQLDPGKTYFVTARTGDISPAYFWAVSTSETETAQPSGNGWSVGFGHYQSGRAAWGSYSDWNIAEIVFATVPTLASSNVTATGATLTIAGHSGDWYYKHTTPTGGVCSTNAVTGTSTTLSTLTGGTAYTFAAYSDSSCTTGNLLATAAQFTTPQQQVSVSNLGESDGSTTFVTSAAYAQEFRTGSNSGGYTLTSVTLGFSLVIDGTGFTASIREKLSNGQPATSDLATLSGTPVSQTQVAFTCSSNCDLSASTDYFIYVTGGSTVHMATTDSDSETGASGWSIANGTRYQQGSWALDPSGAAMKVKVTATEK